jgi:acyl-CoA thioester hydrolase
MRLLRLRQMNETVSTKRRRRVLAEILRLAPLGLPRNVNDQTAHRVHGPELAHRRRVPRVSDFRFSTDIRVRFAETDAQGVAHNSNYLVWFEIARIAYLEEYAGGYPALRETGLESFVLESHVRYRQPAHFDDRLRIHARVGELRGARFRFDYEVSRDGEVIADGWTAHACVDAKTLRPTRIPAALAEAIAKAES